VLLYSSLINQSVELPMSGRIGLNVGAR